jgi:D-alanyl-D-alanine carboxypeptidase
MIADAKEQGVELTVCSAYRPYSSQKRNFDSSVDSYVAAGYSRDQAVTETMRLIAQPGKSEHQTGLAADIVAPSYQRLDEGFADTEAGKWLAENAPDYGFILRYPKDKTEITRIDYEPWHFRYVGTEAAKEIASKGLCLKSIWN